VTISQSLDICNSLVSTQFMSLMFNLICPTSSILFKKVPNQLFSLLLSFHCCVACLNAKLISGVHNDFVHFVLHCFLCLTLPLSVSVFLSFPLKLLSVCLHLYQLSSSQSSFIYAFELLKKLINLVRLWCWLLADFEEKKDPMQQCYRDCYQIIISE